MTGNKNAWRAPLAGLASVAMIATMGVAASTANAAGDVPAYDFTVTFNAGSEGTVSGKETYSEKASVAAPNGKLAYDASSYALASVVATPNNASKDVVFTGWYTAPQGGEKFDPSTFLNKDVTLYAHYALPDDVVTVNFNGGEADYPYTGSNVIKVSKADNKIAKWELPTDRPDNQKALTGWETVSPTSPTEVAVSDDQLTSNLKAVFPSNGNSDPVTLDLDPVTAKAVTVEFDIAGNGYDPAAGDSRVDVKVGDSIELATGFASYDNKLQKRATAWQDQSGDTLESKLDVDEAKAAELTAKGESRWNVNGTKFQAAFVATYYTEINDVDVPFGEELVDSGSKAKLEAAPERNSDYSFAYYTKGVNENSGKHSYSTVKFDEALRGNVNLAAQWSTAKAVVKFNYNYAGKIDEKYYASGDTFTLPTATRDGWTLLGWYVATGTPSNPFQSNGGSEFFYSKNTIGSRPANVNLNNGTHTIEYFDQFKLPANAKLRINDNGNLEWLDTKVADGYDNDGNAKYKSEWKNIYNEVFAAWKRAGADELNNLINQAPIQNENGTAITENKDFTNWSEYVEVMNEIEADKAALENKGELSNEEAAKLAERVQAAQDKLVQTAPVKVYRLYNKWNGDHVYTTSQDESSALSKLGWKAEGVQFNVTTVKFGNAKAVYRLYNPYNGEHLLTADKTEAAGLAEAGWVFDKDGSLTDEDGNPVYFYAPQGATTGVTRLFNPYETVGTHLYTTSSDEIAKNVKLGWIQENVLFNVVK
ncbi:InlB B-repeat-containing protein [Bifidobacterium oedipodis]|uniref:DUF5648 domain-containing protein n=1 Tax=Bifidobacterium oedipodis TaxID=2675322 RepID=A0A7Y0ERB3_9BIFI|nr:InlB B-repeat-containing protein [Bifidobacterium sp. DSM 109957]NMM95009.1 hypothetical protein [Bifidobacterium sp. DSM 109957]